MVGFRSYRSQTVTIKMRSVLEVGKRTMKSLKLIILICGVFSVVSKRSTTFLKIYLALLQVVSLIMMTLSFLGILAYHCDFYSMMRRDPVAYMLFLLYFRSSRCSNFIFWSDLDVNGDWRQPSIPSETVATLRTFVLLKLYMTVSVLLLGSSILLLGKSSLLNN